MYKFEYTRCVCVYEIVYDAARLQCRGNWRHILSLNGEAQFLPSVLARLEIAVIYVISNTLMQLYFLGFCSLKAIRHCRSSNFQHKVLLHQPSCFAQS